ncbi:MAG: DUF2721 domain-containing protein [Candidatus Bathyarchaeota archaeon]|nr:DUF2721 domain-containing protein [Candidatus Bathyarchaeota archaeon]
MDITALIVVLQTSMAPCVLISGVGLLVLSMTNRLGRPLDRIRALTTELKQAEGEQKRVLLEEVDILYRRAKLLQAAVTFSVLSIFFVATIILSLFITATFNVGLVEIIEVLFSASLISLVTSLALFVWDIQLGLNSIKIEIDRWKPR